MLLWWNVVFQWPFYIRIMHNYEFGLQGFNARQKAIKVSLIPHLAYVYISALFTFIWQPCLMDDDVGAHDHVLPIPRCWPLKQDMDSLAFVSLANASSH